MSKTILVTGGAGFIGSWIVKTLVEQGNTVRVSVRNKSKTAKYQHILDLEKTNTGKVELWQANLITPNGFDEVAKGCDSIIHVASPFTLDTKNPQENLINPALKGTQNVLNAATKSGTVKRVIVTASCATIYGDNVDMKNKNITEFTEDINNTTSSLTHNPYSYSKVLAEQEANKIHAEQDSWSLAFINPAFVMGPAFSKDSNSGSITFMKDILSGKYKSGAPELHFGFVDVRDVAQAHILALENEKAQGRHLICGESMDMISFTKIIEANFPKQFKLPKTKAPKFLMMLLAPVFGVTRKFVKLNVGYPVKFSNKKSIRELGMKYIPIEKSIVDMVKWLK